MGSYRTPQQMASLAARWRTVGKLVGEGAGWAEYGQGGDDLYGPLATPQRAEHIRALAAQRAEEWTTALPDEMTRRVARHVFTEAFITAYYDVLNFD